MLTAGPGTVGIHHQSVLHRRAAATGTGLRRMLEYSYWRTMPQERDWLPAPGFGPSRGYKPERGRTGPDGDAH